MFSAGEIMNIILGVTASVAAIKTTQLARQIQQFANVRIVLTEAAEYFVKPQLAELKEIEIYHDKDEWPALNAAYDLSSPILHIEMRRWADCMLVAPLDANTLAKVTLGFCDNLLTSIIRAWDDEKPLILCPAMNTFMWNNAPTAEQIATLKTRKAHIIEPIEKKLACNDIGMGAMANVDDIIQAVRKTLHL